MSIKPIDFHLTYANTVNESKTKQLDHNRMKESNQLATQQQQSEIQRNRQKTVQAEEAKGKTINNQDKNKQEQSDGNGASHGRKKYTSVEAGEKTPPRNVDNKGLKIDILI